MACPRLCSLLDGIMDHLYIRNISGAKRNIIEPTSSTACPFAAADVMPRLREGRCCSLGTGSSDSGFNNTLRSALGVNLGTLLGVPFFFDLDVSN